MIAAITEGSLRETFLDFYETMDEEHCQIEALNVDSDNTVTDIKIIDFCQILGAAINRGENRIKRVRPMSFGPMNSSTVPNFRLYMPTDLSSFT